MKIASNQRGVIPLNSHNLHPEAAPWLDRCRDGYVADTVPGQVVDVHVKPRRVSSQFVVPRSVAKPLAGAAITGAAIFCSSCGEGTQKELTAYLAATIIGYIAAAAVGVSLLMRVRRQHARAKQRVQQVDREWEKAQKRERREVEEIIEGLPYPYRGSLFVDSRSALKHLYDRYGTKVVPVVRSFPEIVREMIPKLPAWELDKLLGAIIDESMTTMAVSDVGPLDTIERLQVALDVANRVLPLNDVVQLFRQVRRLRGGYRGIDQVLGAIPPVLEQAERTLPRDRIMDVLNELFDRRGDVFRCIRAHEYLPKALKVVAKELPRDQRADHLIEIIAVCREWTGDAFRALPSLLSKMPFNRAANMLIETARAFRRHQDFAETSPHEIIKRLSEVSDALEGIIPSEQIASFVGKLVGRHGRTSIAWLYTSYVPAFKSLSGVLSSDQIWEIIKPDKRLSPAGNAALSLYKFMLYRKEHPNPDLAAEAFAEELAKEGERARAQGLPTVGGKVGGKKNSFNKKLIGLVRALVIRVSDEILGENPRGQTLFVLPAARSSYEAVLLLDLLREVGVFKDGSTLRHQIALSGRFEEDAKFISLALHSAQPFTVPYPQELPEYAGFKTVAPITEGGGFFDDINETRKGTDRFDIPLMRMFPLDDPVGVLKKAVNKDEGDRSQLEHILVQLYRGALELWNRLPREKTLDGVSDDELKFVMVGEKDGKGFVMPFEKTRPDVDALFIKGLESVYGEGLSQIRENHVFTIYTAQLLTWAMQSERGSIQHKIYHRFKKGMRALYRDTGIEGVLDTTWKKRKWQSIYPSLATLEAVEEKDRHFRQKVKALLQATVHKLEKLQLITSSAEEAEDDSQHDDG